MSLTTSILRRVLIMFPMLIGVTMLAFIVSNMVPSDPLFLLISEKAMNNPEIVEATVKKWGLDRSKPEQYMVYLTNLLHGDLGTSFRSRRPVADDLKEYFPATVELGSVAMTFAILFGLPLGIVAALKSGKWIDHLARFISLFGASMPPFWSGLMALFLLWFKVPIMTGPGRLDTHLTLPPKVTGLILVDSLMAGDKTAFFNGLHHLILPAIILSWFTLAIIARVTRASLLEVLQMDYIRTARAKGLREGRVILIHALRNAFIPTLTVLGLAFAWLMAGAIMTETIFAWPGIGRYAVEAAANMDYPAVLGTTLLFAVIFMITNLFVDILYCVLDPRIRQV
jgi:peptide/nickel transport system permease protein